MASKTFSALSGTSTYTLTGGSRGAAPLASQITSAYQVFNYPNKYPVTILMDPAGGQASTINNIIKTLQSVPYFMFGISTIPLGNTPAQMISYRQGLGISSDQLALYSNWAKVVDPYNNSQVWISNVGSIGAKYALMADVYDGLAPAGIDENNKRLRRCQRQDRQQCRRHARGRQPVQV